MRSVSMRLWTVFAAFAVMAFAFPAAGYAQTRPYDLAQLDGSTCSAAEQARAAQTRAIAAAARAQASVVGTVNFQGDQGDRYLGEGYTSPNAPPQRQGYGLISWSDGEFYAGQFRPGERSGVMHGVGVYAFVDGRIYEGEWRDEKRHGYGVQWNADGSIAYAGVWVNGDPLQ